ncbi:MAG: hypothetical protein M3Y57_14000 [Acidobacteriota bacterium]|nr:hypothetical protein [Acidobacteriota bacterium]
MIPELREQFNANWQPANYAEFLRRVDERSGTHVQFRLSETPVFLPKPLIEKMVRYGLELYDQLVSNAEYRKAAHEAIPPQFRVPNESDHPLSVQADFGLVRDPNGELEPKLVEIQGFPSIYALQQVIAEEYRNAYHLDAKLQTLLGGLTRETYVDVLRRAILGSHSPENVVLLEIDPYEQKTLPDFLLTQQMLGLRIANISEVNKRRRKLYLDGIEIRRIYNRVIVDELVRKKIESEFSFTDDLDVEWAGHPNWFFLLSKFSLPWFDHPCVPQTQSLSETPVLPENLEDYVLKPLYSFAGLGVKVGPLRSEIESIPKAERSEYILQQRMEFVPTLETPSGPTKAEIWVMYIWDGALKPVTTILRTGRSKMMGVDFNKGLDWVGASAGFYLP